MKNQWKEISKNSIIEGAANATSNGLVNTYITPLALAIGANVMDIGILNSIPKLAGVVAQPVSEVLFLRYKNKTICLNAVAYVYILLFLISVILIFSEQLRMLLLIILFSSFQFFGSISTTAWISWISELVPLRKKGSFFGKRNMIATLCVFFGVMVAGWLLSAFSSIYTFSLLFIAASLLGMVSHNFLDKIPEPRKNIIHKKTTFFPKMSKSFKRFVIFIAAMNFATFIVAPFFAVYMLRELEIGYTGFAMVISIETIIAIFSHKYWGKLTDKFGDRIVMRVCSLLTPFVPLFYALAPNTATLVVIGIFSGFVWAGFDLSWFNYLITIAQKDKKNGQELISVFRFFTLLSAFLGPLAGGFLASIFSGRTIFIFTGLQILFVIAFLLRMGCSLFLFRIDEIMVKKKTHLRNIFIHFIIIYPIKGIIHNVERIYVKRI